MKWSFSRPEFYFCAAIILSLSAILVSCSQGSLQDDKAFVVPERLKLRNSTALAARVVGELKGGDQVTVNERETAEDGELWLRVKGPSGESGWIKSSHLVKWEIVEKSRQIAEETKDVPIQAIGKSNGAIKLRLAPDRSNEDNVAISLPMGTLLEIVGHERKPRPARIEGKDEAKDDSNGNVKYDEWYKVRLKDYAVLPAGWVYRGLVTLDVPPEIFYFVSSGREIVGWQKIGTVTGNDSKSGEHFLALERKTSATGDELDFDRIKALAYDPATRNYSTPFREDVAGRFPVSLKMEGTRGHFQINTVDKNGQTQTQGYSVEMLEGGKVKVTKSLNH